jgi:hypothetical protein
VLSDKARRDPQPHELDREAPAVGAGAFNRNGVRCAHRNSDAQTTSPASVAQPDPLECRAWAAACGVTGWAFWWRLTSAGFALDAAVKGPKLISHSGFEFDSPS